MNSINISFGATLGIGSLPFTDPVEAVKHVFMEYNIPFLPELPKVSPSESMIARSFWGMKGFQLGDRGRVQFTMDPFPELLERVDCSHPSHASAGGLAWPIFLERAASHDSLIKIQHAGPFTLARCVFLPDGRPLIESSGGLDLCVQLILARLNHLLHELKKSGVSDVLVFIDEPLLLVEGIEEQEGEFLGGPGGLQSTLEKVTDAVHARGAIVGLHSCRPAPWDTIIASGMDILSVDAVNYLEDLLSHRAALLAYLECGGWISWGIVPTLENDRMGVENHLSNLLNRLSHEFGEVSHHFLKQSLFSPACGTGLLSIEKEEKIARLLLSARQHVTGRL